jgi:23S rRNA pseudouridine1911/1915/1917 synthase
MNDVLFTIGENPPPRLDKALARNVPERAISRSRLSRMIADGAVEVNGVVATEQRLGLLKATKLSSTCLRL